MDIIEVLVDGDEAFGDDAPNHPRDDTGGRRWVGPVAAVLLVALIGYGVATSASSGDSPHARPASTTTTGSIAPLTVATIQPTTMPFFAVDPPPAFSVHYASLQQPDRAAVQGYAYELWATKGASANSGSWFSITSYRGASTLRSPNAYRVQATQSTIAISHVSGGHSVTQFVVGGFGVTITSFGWSDDDLVRLAGSVHPDGQTVDFTDSWFTSDHQVVSSVQPWLAVQSIPTEQVTYLSADDPNAAIAITVGRRSRSFDRGPAGDRYFALRFLLEDPTPFDVAGLQAVAGTIVGRDNEAMATWIDEDNVFTVSAPMPVSDVIDIARTVHEVSSSEWERMRLQARRTNSPRAAIVPSLVPSISSGTDAESSPWAIGVSMAYSGRQRWINWRWEGSGFESSAHDDPQITTVVDDERTYVLADLPRSIATTAHLEVSRSGVDPVVVPFNDAGAEMDRKFAAYAFSEATPYTAQIIGADGVVLANWPAT